MKINILIGGQAGQGINKVSEIISNVLISRGYFVFNYRDYESLIRGGHNFNVLCVSDEKIGSVDSKYDIIVSLSSETLQIHKSQITKRKIIIDSSDLKKEFGRNLNVYLAGAVIKLLGIKEQELINEIKKEFKSKEITEIAKKGYLSYKKIFDLKKLNDNLKRINGSQGVAQGAVSSKIDIYLSYPMTPATGVMNELALNQEKNKLMVFQPENEIAVINSALGASFSGAKTMIGTSGGGYDLMSEAISFQGISEIPLVIYLASRPGPGTGIPTHTSQSDLNIALRSGHGEFPRVVVAPGDPIECIEKTNEMFYVSEKFKILGIILSDKHLAESDFSILPFKKKILVQEIKREVPGKSIVKASSYEHDVFGNTTEDSEIAKQNADRRLRKYNEMKKFIKKFEMIKIHGDKTSKNLIIAWGSTKGVILDAIRELRKENISFKFLQVIYLKPLSDSIKKELLKSKNIILIENNSTGQLGRLIREKTGIKIQKKILKYNGRPFWCDELKQEIKKLI